ncbi:MAG TPA: SusC/RagA family TonB-linked outer membrane protein [Chitinophagaceae bacterium]
MRKLLFLVLSAMLTGVVAFAQDRAISGRITDEKSQPVVGASVAVKNSRVGTSTDANGNFTLTLPASAKAIVISAVGFIQQEVTLTNASTVTAVLKQDAQVMENVVITGYTREKRSNFAGAATVLSSKVVETVPVGSFDQALQGRAPGVLVNSGGGQPGSSANIQIRGPQSISGAFAQPLFVIDGVPMPSFDMQTINPNDFESLTVLKDASASALYGARGGAGVIVITTKKGKAGATNLTFRTQVGFTQKPDFTRIRGMNTAEILQYEERLGVATGSTNNQFNVPGWVYSPLNPANASLPATSPAGNPYAPSKARFASILDSIRGIDMDYSDVFYRQGVSQTHELNLSAGNDKTRVFLSGQYFKQEGIDLGSTLTRYSGRMNIEHTNNRLTVSWNTMGGYSISEFAEGDFLGNSARNPFQMTFRAKTYENPYKADGTLNFGSSTSLNNKVVANLLEGIANSTWRQNQIKINSGLTIQYRFTEKLTFRNTAGLDASNDNFTRFVVPASYIGSLQTYNSGTYLDATRAISQFVNTTSLIYNTRFAERHDLEVGGYFEIVRGFQKGFGMQMYNLDPRLGETGQGAGALPTNGATTMPQLATGAKTGFGIRSFFATARYAFDNKYIVTANVRRDGTSRIVNPENQEVTSWSAGVIWNALRETFMQSNSLFSDLRLRASYGVVPNIASIPTTNYGIRGIFNITNFHGPQVPSYTTNSYAGSSTGGIIPSTSGNPELEIEKVQKANIGVDAAFWNNRVRVTFELYKNRTVDLYVRKPLSAITGFANLDINAGIMTNKGIEVQAAFDLIRNRDVTLTLGANHAMNKNTIEDLGAVTEYFLGTFLIKEGLPYGSHYTTNYLGADPATGRPMFETPDGKTTTDAAKAGQFAKYGTFIPVHVGGITLDVSYKRFTISALFSYQFDVVRSNNQKNWMMNGTTGFHATVNARRDLLTEQWQKAGDQKFIHSPLYDRGFSSTDLEDAKFMRFRNLVVAYQIPVIRIGGTQAIKGGRFYVQGQNLFIWSPWTGTDPEDNNNISLNEYPNPKMFVVGLDINF